MTLDKHKIFNDHHHHHYHHHHHHHHHHLKYTCMHFWITQYKIY